MKVLGSAVLAMEAIVILLATALATSVGAVANTTAAWVAGLVLMVLLLACIGTLRRPWGPWAGWALQALILLASIVVGWTMLAIGGIFVGLWWAAVHYGTKVDALRAGDGAAGS